MSKALKNLTGEELDAYCSEIARAGEAARVVGISVPVVEHAAAEAAAEVSRREWGT